MPPSGGIGSTTEGKKMLPQNKYGAGDRIKFEHKEYNEKPIVLEGKVLRAFLTGYYLVSIEGRDRPVMAGLNSVID